MKRILVNGKEFLVLKEDKFWSYRFHDLLILMPTLKELKKCIAKELETIS